MLFDTQIKWSFPDKDLYPQAQFGAKRKHDIHTGIDIYVPEHTEVYSLIAGKVVNIEWFTGIKSIPPTPWWEDTQAIWVEDMSINPGYVLVYGEIKVNEKIAIGDFVDQDTVLGTIKKVLKKDKGINPTTMLHLELYESKPKETAIWLLDQEKPKGLLNPLNEMKYFL